MYKVIAIIFSILLWALPATAQAPLWLQLEAQPTLRQAQASARSYAGRFSDVSGFQMRSGWYAIALGPYSANAAAERLRALRRSGQIPSDAYTDDGAGYRQQFWPVGVSGRAAATQPPAPAASAPAPVAVVAKQTPAQARRAERDLSGPEREQVQEALKWEGFYSAAIDGDFGRGTRGAMRAYQNDRGYTATGVLTTAQRGELLAGYHAAFAALGLQTVDDAAAGIQVTMPAAMVKFARYEPPFVHYDSIGDSGVRVLLISQKGDQNSLFGLYDVMQTLEIVPQEGARERSKNSFVLSGQSSTLHSYTYAALKGGMVKGFTLIWRPGDEKLMTRVTRIMRDSFTPDGEHALDEMLGDPGAAQSVDLLSGLDIRRPDAMRSGFYVDHAGAVLTTTAVLGQCRRITIGDDLDAQVAARDDALGLAVLRPAQALAPMAVAAFQTGVPRLKSEVAVAGFSYGDALDLPVLTYGTLADLKGLAGETGLNRLALDALPGDAGGPVFDQSGAVMGVLLARTEGARKLPGAVRYAANVPAIADFLSANGVAMAASERREAIAPEDLTTLASDMTVLVSCWN